MTSRRRLPLLLASFVVALTAGCSGGTAAEVDQYSIIVSGASGQLGGQVVEDLLALGVAPARLILVSRTPDGLQHYADMGASVRYGDFNEPESLLEAYAGGDRMLLISINTLGDRPRLHGNAIDAAVEAGVGHIAYTSFVDVENEGSPLAADHRATEEMLRESGVAWTMLRNQLYMDGLVGQATRMVADGRVEVNPNATLTAYVTRSDCAAAAAAVLATPGHENRVYDITGPAAIGPREIALAAAEVTGVPIEIVGEAPTAPAAETRSSRVSTDVADLTGRPAMSVTDLLRANQEALLAAR